MQRGGFSVLRGLFTSPTIERLRDESRACKQRAAAVSVARPDAEQLRGGNPARRFLNAPGGAIQHAVYHDPDMIRTIASVTGLPIVTTGTGGTFTYYCRPKDFLGIHRDIVGCDIAVITCLEDSGATESGGKLCLYPERIWETLGSLRRDPVRGAVPLRLAAGDTAVLLGGVVPHCTLPVAPGQNRVVSLLCYRAELYPVPP
jgi:hypothetical protein